MTEPTKEQKEYLGSIMAKMILQQPLTEQEKEALEKATVLRKGKKCPWEKDSESKSVEKTRDGECPNCGSTEIHGCMGPKKITRDFK